MARKISDSIHEHEVLGHADGIGDIDPRAGVRETWTVQSMVPPLLNAKMPCLNTLCRGATRFSLIASFSPWPAYLPFVLSKLAGAN